MPLELDNAIGTPVPGPAEPSPGNIKGQWPRMLNIGEEKERQLDSWLRDEIWNGLTEKQDILRDWERWQIQYWARSETPVRNFPFRRAANVVIPLTAIAVEAIHARLMNTIFAVEPFWSIRPRTKTWIDAAKPVERWLQTEVEEPNSLDVYRFCNDSILEGIKLGTMIGKSGYRRLLRKTNVDLPDGTTEPRFVEVMNGATLEYVPCANFIMRSAFQDPQESSWVGEQHEFSWGQMKKMSESGRMRPESVDLIRHWWHDVRTEIQSGDAEEYHETLDRLQKVEPVWTQVFKVFEIWCAFDIDEDGIDEEIVVDYHWDSGIILSIRNNWYEDLRRPYRVSQYVKVEGRLWGIGVGKQSEQFQIAITTVHRQRLDNATLANMRMLAVKKGSGISPDEPIFPGKMWFVDDPQRDLQVVQLSEVYTSAFNNETALLGYQERYTGVNEVLLGLQPQGTPGTATGDLARIAEGNKRFDLVLKNIRMWLGHLGNDVVGNYQQFGNQHKHFLVLDPDKAIWVEQILSMPRELISRGAIVEITATSSITNRQAEQQQWLGLFQIISAYYERLLGLTQLIQDPQLVQQAILRAVAAGDTAMKHLLRTFNVPDLDQLLLLTDEERRDARPEGGVGGAPNQSNGGADGGVSTAPQPGGPGTVPPNALDPRVASLLGRGARPGENGERGNDFGRLAARGV